MKLLFTADIHIKLGQKNVPVEWAKNRYRLFFRKLQELSSDKSLDKVIIGGDIFDKLPNMEELELYFELISGLDAPTIIYSGNHEAIKKNTTFFTSLKEVSRRVNEYVIVLDDFATIDNIDFIPYNKLKEYHPSDIDFHSKILCTHVRGEIPPHVKPEVPLELFDRWDLVLAGDLHSYENSQRNILYPGSPITTSFHRSRVDTGVLIVDTDTLEHRWIKLDLPQLIRKTIQAGEPMPPGDVDHIIYEIEGDLSQLADVENTDLIDKKVVKRNNEAALLLSADMTIQQEVEEYLRYILEMNEGAISKALEELQYVL